MKMSQRVIVDKRHFHDYLNYNSWVDFFRTWCPGADLNHRHEDFQSTALPLSYPGKEKRYALGGIVLGCQAATVQRDFR